MKKGRSIHPFRLLALVLGVGTVVVGMHLPGRMVQLESMELQKKAAMDAYYDAQSINNQLAEEYRESGTDDFVERTARRDYGYCWYGEVIYEVDNIEQYRATR